MIATYHRHYFDHAAGHVCLDKTKGAFVIHLEGAAAMKQEELDFYGELLVSAINNMTPEQRRQTKRFEGVDHSPDSFTQRPE